MKEYGVTPDYRNISHSISESIPIKNLPQNSSIKEFTDEEIILTFNRLQMEKESSEPSEIGQELKEMTKIDETSTKIDDENYQEFLKWMEVNRKKTQANKKVKPSKDVDEDVHVVDESDHKQSDFEEFKDAISDESDESLKVPLVIIEENEISGERNDNVLAIEENIFHDSKLSESVGDAKLILSDDAVQNLSISNTSLVSITLSDENCNKKRPATHNKGPAPPPPPTTAATTNVIMQSDGFYYDKLTRKLFKETEL